MAIGRVPSGVEGAQKLPYYTAAGVSALHLTPDVYQAEAQKELAKLQETWRKEAQAKQYTAEETYAQSRAGEKEAAATALASAQEAYASARAGEKEAAATKLYAAQERYAKVRAAEKETFAGARYGEFQETEARAGERFGEAVGAWESRKSVAAARARGVMTGVAPGYGTLARAEFEKRGVLETAEEKRKAQYAGIRTQYAAARQEKARLGLAAQPPAYAGYK